MKYRKDSNITTFAFKAYIVLPYHIMQSLLNSTIVISIRQTLSCISDMIIQPGDIYMSGWLFLYHLLLIICILTNEIFSTLCRLNGRTVFSPPFKGFEGLKLIYLTTVFLVIIIVHNPSVGNPF